MNETETRLRDLTDDWKQWLGAWCDELPPDLPVRVYSWDDDVDGDQWEDFPHLAIKDDSGPIPRSLAWPIHVDGWADATRIGWAGIAELLDAGRRT